MTSAEIITATRFGIREPVEMDVSDTEITAMTLRGVIILGNKLKEGDPSFLNKRISFSSNTHVFAWPSDCMKIMKVWDLESVAGTITGAADNGSGLVQITLVDHGFSDGDIVLQHDIEGTTEANGIFKVANVDTNTYDLTGSTFSNAWTAGGKAFALPTNPDEIKLINLSESTGSNDRRWYPREKQIIIDDMDFSNDLMVDYEGRPDAIDDVPAEYHDGLVGWNVINLIRIPAPDSASYYDFVRSKNFWVKMWNVVNDQIDSTFAASSEPSFVIDDWRREVEDY